MNQAKIHAGMRNIIGGRTFYGRPSTFKPLAMAEGEASWHAASTIIERGILHLHEPGDEELTALTWKVVQYCRKLKMDGHQFLRGMSGAVTLANNPQRMLLGKLSVEGAYRIHRNELLQMQSWKKLTDENLAEKYALACQAISERVLLSYTVRYRLFRLTHPKHLVDEGVHLHNCLFTRFRNGVIPNRTYWENMENGKAVYLSFRRWDQRLAVLSMHKNEIIEVDFKGDDRDKLALRLLLKKAFGHVVIVPETELFAP